MVSRPDAMSCGIQSTPEVEEYCISDIKSLKAGCQKFREEFSQEAQFDPMEQCCHKLCNYDVTVLAMYF